MTRTRVAALIVASAVCSGAALAQAKPAAAKEPVIITSADLKWVDNPTVTGAKIAVVFGDPKTGSYAAFKSLTDGTTLAMHTHTQDSRVIGVAGTITLTIKGMPAKQLGPSSYALIPGGVEHMATCKGTAGAACTYYEAQPGAADIKFVGK